MSENPRLTFPCVASGRKIRTTERDSGLEAKQAERKLEQDRQRIDLATFDSE